MYELRNDADELMTVCSTKRKAMSRAKRLVKRGSRTVKVVDPRPQPKAHGTRIVRDRIKNIRTYTNTQSWC